VECSERTRKGQAIVRWELQPRMGGEFQPVNARGEGTRTKRKILPEGGRLSNKGSRGCRK